MNITYRPSKLEDIHFLKELYREETIAKQLYASPEEETEFVRWAISPDRFILLLAEEKIGTFTLVASGYTATVGVALHQNWRGKGIGKKALELIEEEAKKRGHRVLSADIYKNNESAVELFQHNGFQEVVWYEKNLG